MIENVDSTEKEIIEFDKIENVVFSKENQKEFSISYSTNPEQNDIKLSKFSTNLRTQIIADILNLIVKKI